MATYNIYFPKTGTPGSNGSATIKYGGDGGVGYYAKLGNTVYNRSYVYGGAGGKGLFGSPGYTPKYQTGGVNGGNGGNASFGGQGGVGVEIASSVSLINLPTHIGAAVIEGGAGVIINGGTVMDETNGFIYGGAGGNAGAGGLGGSSSIDYGARFPSKYGLSGGSYGGGKGGVGVDVFGAGYLVNSGTIEGGFGPGGSGVGVFVDGGTVTNLGGAISGGGSLSGVGAAVKFGDAFSSRLVVDPGAKFYGQVAASIVVNDTLELRGPEGYHSGTPITLGTQFTSFQTLDFAPGAAWTVDVGAAAAPASGLTITGFAAGDTIDVTNLAPGVVLADFNSINHVLNISDGTLNFAGDFTGEQFVFYSDGGSGTDIRVQSACFSLGTRILSARGEVPIESLKIGDRVETLAGIMRPIRWIGLRRYSAEFAAGNAEVAPIRIRAGALGCDLPKRDLWVSPEHAMFIDDMLIPARDLTNGHTIVQEEWVGEVTYFHLEFDTHTVIYAEGAPSESFVDDESRQMFDNAEEYYRLYPDAIETPARFCAQRVEDGCELEVVRQRLARIAADLPGATPLPAALSQSSRPYGSQLASP